MRYIKRRIIAAALGILVVGVSVVSAQTCDAAAASLEALVANCGSIGRGTLCQNGQPTSFDGLEDFGVDTLAFGRIQANYPDVDGGQFVDLAFIGGLQVDAVVQTSLATLPPRVPVKVTLGAGKANVRPRPVRSGDPIAQLEDGTELNATGLSRNGTWVRVQLPDQPQQSAWINRSLLQSRYDMGLLPVVTSDDPVPQYPQFTPMQAFAFTSASPCAGIVLQSSDNNQARLRVNSVDLELHSATVFLQSLNGLLSINVMEGIVQVRAQETTTSSVAGSVVRVPLDETGQPNGALNEPVPYDESALAGLAGNYTQRVIPATSAAAESAIQAALVTPLSGIWKFTYPPPYVYTSVEGPQCGEMTVKGGDQLFEVSVASDGSSFSAFNPDIAIGAGVRVRPGLYELNDFSFQVLSPTEMTTTYDTNSLAACTSIITVTAHWVSSEG